MKPILAAIIAALIFIVPGRVRKSLYNQSPKSTVVQFKVSYISPGKAAITDNRPYRQQEDFLHEAFLWRKP